MSKVPKGGPADIAGLCVGDIVKAVDGTLISRKLKAFVALVNGKTQIDLDVERVSGGNSDSVAGASVSATQDVTPKQQPHAEGGTHAAAGESTTAAAHQPSATAGSESAPGPATEKERVPSPQSRLRLRDSLSPPFFLTTSDGRFEEDPATAVHWEVVKMLSNDGGSVRLVEGILLGQFCGLIDLLRRRSRCATGRWRRLLIAVCLCHALPVERCLVIYFS